MMFFKWLLLTFTSMLLISCQSQPIKSENSASSNEIYYAYLNGGESKTAVILCHGKGKYPTWKVVDPLRKAIHSELGFHTLSLQMPKDDVRWDDYANFFPEAHANIAKAIQVLKTEKGVETVYLMGHSMGSRMASSFKPEAHNTQINGLIIAGCRNNGGEPLSCIANVKNRALPILDIWGEGDVKDDQSASERKTLQSPHYQQVQISGANHKFDGYDFELNGAVIQWLKAQSLGN